MRLVRNFLAVLLALGVAAVMAYLLLCVWLDAHIFPSTFVWSVPLGGLTPAEALHRLQSSALDERATIVLLGPDGERWTFTPRALGVSLDGEATVRAAYAVGHEAGRPCWEGRVEQLLGDGASLSPRFTWDEEIAREQLVSLAAQIERPPRDATLLLEKGRWTVRPAQMGRRLALTATLEALEPLLRSASGGELPLVVETLPPQVGDEPSAQAVMLLERIEAEPLQLHFEGEQWTMPPEYLRTLLRPRLRDHGVHIALDEAALRAFLTPIAEALSRPPVNARFHFDEATGTLTTIAPGREGRALDIEATIAQITAVLQAGGHHVPLVVRAVPPRYTADLTAEALGVREVIAVGESYFTGSSSARDHNIRVGASRFDGVVIAPGETFSFNTLLGEVTEEEGYEQAYVILGDRTVVGVGGGLCQVATTVFRAAFYAGYPITERWPHAYRVRYYELGGFGPGFDATIYAPQLDFRFVNDGPSPLLIQTEVDRERARLRFVFVSTSDGRSVEQVGPTWSDPEPPPPPVYEYDPSLPSGTVKMVERAKEGLTAVLERIVHDAEGRLLYHDRFVSHFLPWPARYRYGPGFIPPPEAVIVGAEE